MKTRNRDERKKRKKINRKTTIIMTLYTRAYIPITKCAKPEREAKKIRRRR